MRPQRQFLIDALLLRDVLCGVAPLARSTRLLVGWPEYIWLLKTITAAGGNKDDALVLPDVLDRVDAALTNVIGEAGWLVAFFDLRRAREVDGVQIETVVPEDEAAAGVVAAMIDWDLDERSATNLVLAESLDVPFFATPSTLTGEMQRALLARGVRHRVVYDRPSLRH